MRIYTIVCRYFLDGEVIDITLSEMLKRLNIKPQEKVYYSEDGDELCSEIDYGWEYVIEYNLENAYKMKYCIEKRDKKELGNTDCECLSSRLLEIVAYLNERQADVVSELDFDKFINLYGGYGNNYIKQIKGELKDVFKK